MIKEKYTLETKPVIRTLSQKKTNKITPYIISVLMFWFIFTLNQLKDFMY